MEHTFAASPLPKLVVKMKFENDIRRVTLLRHNGSRLSLLLHSQRQALGDYVPTTYDDLVRLVCELFPTVKEQNDGYQGTLQIKYLDDESDLISVSSTREVIEAVSVATQSSSTPPVLRLFISCERPTKESQRTVHFAVPTEINSELPTALSPQQERRLAWYEKQQHVLHNRLLGRFVADVTVQNGSVMTPKAQFVKVWRMRNEGKTQWPTNTTLVFVGGDLISKNAVKVIKVPSVQPGIEVDIHVEMEAPSKPGRYMSYWRLCHPSGRRFGQRVWAHIKVEDPSACDSTLESRDSLPNVEAVDLPLYQIGYPSSTSCQSDVITPAAVQTACNPKCAEEQEEERTDTDSESDEGEMDSGSVIESYEKAWEHESELLSQLTVLGFGDKQLNKVALEKNNYDLLKAISELLNNSMI